MNDETKIKATVQLYIDGAVTGSSEVMKQAFHQDATVFGYLHGELFAAPIQGLFDWVDEIGSASTLTARITKLSIVGTVASVELDLKDWNGVHFTDIFTVLNVNDDWKIMNKVFHAHDG